LVPFLSLPPLLNGLADFASVGVTRFYLRRGLSNSIQMSAIYDLLWALAIFFALGFAIIAIIHLVRPQDDIPLLNLTSLFDDLNDPDRRGQYWWLLFMLFSTLIPTVLHAIVATLAFVTMARPNVRYRIAAWLDQGAQGDKTVAKIGRTALCASLTLAIVTPLFVLVEGARLFPGIVTGTIWIFETFAQSIGAV